MSKFRLKIPARSPFSGITINQVLKYLGVSEAKVKEWLRELIKINGEIPKGVLKTGDVIEITFPTLTFQPFPGNLEIVYEDDYVLIVNKPAKVLIHPDGSSNKTLANMVADYYEKNNKDCDVRHIHRLDMETTGGVLFAKDPVTCAALSQMMENGLIERTYIGLVQGVFKKYNGLIDKKIGRDRHNSGLYRVSESGKQAITYFHVLTRLNLIYGNEPLKASVVVFKLATGRTHQIRVHMADSGHSLIGDTVYGGLSLEKARIRELPSLDTYLLHSWTLVFFHPILRVRLKLEVDPIPFIKRFIPIEKTRETSS